MGVLYSSGVLLSRGQMAVSGDIFDDHSIAAGGGGTTRFQYIETRGALNVLQSANQPLPRPIKGFSGPKCQYGHC